MIARACPMTLRYHHERRWSFAAMLAAASGFGLGLWAALVATAYWLLG